MRLIAMRKKMRQYKQHQSENNDKFDVKMHKVSKEVFTPGQIRMLLNPSQKRIVWSSEDIAIAMALRCVSPKAYRYLKNVMHMPLPSLQTLRRWASNIDVGPGILNKVLDCMKYKSRNMKEHEKLVAIMFGEIHISNRVAIDRKKQHVIGPYKTIQCVMVRSLFSNWKQPVYYDYDARMQKEIIFKIISKLYYSGYTIVAMTCDMGPTNMGLWGKLEIGVESDRCYFQHPENKNLKIFVFADSPHLLKLIRNHLIDNGFTTLGGRVDKKCIERILAINAKDVKVTFHISQYHLDVQGSERQKVLPAAQLLSDRLPTAIEWYGHNGYLAQLDWAETAQVFRSCNDWFDVFNSSSKFGKHEKKNAYGVNLTAQNNILGEMNRFMNQVKVGRHKSLLSFQKGIIISNNSLQQLLPYLKDLCSNFNVEYILTRRLNQDVLEHFFSFIRATSGVYNQPNALDFMYRLRKYILGKQSANLFCNVGSCNVRTESVSPLVSSESCSVLSEMINPYILEDEPEEEEEEIL